MIVQFEDKFFRCRVNPTEYWILLLWTVGNVSRDWCEMVDKRRTNENEENLKHRELYGRFFLTDYSKHPSFEEIEECEPKLVVKGIFTD